MVKELFRTIAENKFAEFRELLGRYPYLADSKLEQGVSGILFAVYHGRPEYAAELVKSGATVGIHEAAALGDLPAVCKLIDAEPALVNAYSADGFQPLGLAAFFGKADVAKYLLKHGADVNSASQNQQKVAPIHSASASGSSEIVAELIGKGADINARQQGGYTALHEAIHAKNLNLIRILVEGGADCGAENDSGQSPKGMLGEEPLEEIRKILRACR